MICLGLSQPTIEDSIYVMQKHQQEIDMIELRIDMLHNFQREMVYRFCKKIPKHINSICTIRRQKDGGRWKLSEKLRKKYLRQFLEQSLFNFIDVEEDWWCAEQNEEWKESVLCSLHDMQGIPHNIQSRITHMAQCAHHIKIAVTINSIREALQFLDIIQRAQSLPVHKIYIAMGEYGLFSRILASYLGSKWTYTYAGEQPLAPGQISVDVLNNVYRYSHINRSTKIFAIVGNPIAHSKSPVFHNEEFKKRNLNARYIPLLVDDISTFFHFATRLPLHGFSITTPFKNQLLPYLTQTDKVIQETHSCNTVLASSSHTWKGINTDAPGFMAPLQAQLPARSAKVLIIGAGGAARVISYILLQKKYNVYIVNRTVKHAITLAKDFIAFGHIHTLDYRQALLHKFDLIIQSSTVGMAPYIDQDPFPSLTFSGREIVYDIIYNPLKTKFLLRAEQSGCTIITGIHMFNKQAQLQSHAFITSLVK